jgi:PncC family amidohydrolase
MKGGPSMVSTSQSRFEERAVQAGLKRMSATLQASGDAVAVAESCTGGMLGALITSVPGSSCWFRGGVIAYANDEKRDLLGVKDGTLARSGAVSAATARQMAVGARRRLRADIGVATTGIAGPGGGTTSKPVGLVYIAVAAAGGTTVKRFHLKGNRARVRAQTCSAALGMLVRSVGQDAGRR